MLIISIREHVEMKCNYIYASRNNTIYGLEKRLLANLVLHDVSLQVENVMSKCAS